MILVLDYGMGNLGSISNMLKRLEVAHEVSGDPIAIERADGVILPGVGAFDRGMQALRERGLRASLDEAVRGRNAPLLGICLGMHLLARGSEEGVEEGLGYIPADVVRLDQQSTGGRKIPHMGWNRVDVSRDGLLPLDTTQRYYFVHSFVMRCDSASDVVGRTSYGFSFASVVQRDTVAGVQFHPEKSHRFGMEVLRRFSSSAIGS